MKIYICKLNQSNCKFLPLLRHSPSLIASNIENLLVMLALPSLTKCTELSEVQPMAMGKIYTIFPYHIDQNNDLLMIEFYLEARFIFFISLMLIRMYALHLSLSLF